MQAKENRSENIEILKFWDPDQAPFLTFIVGVHWDEKAPIKAIAAFREFLADKKILEPFRIIFANGEAISENRRFIDKDLNNCFSDESSEAHESRIAQKLKLILPESKYNFDFHTTDFHIEEPYSIISIYNDEVRAIIEWIWISNAVFSDKDSLIKYATNWIWFEVWAEGEESTVKNAFDLMLKILGHFWIITNIVPPIKHDLSIFLIYQVIKKNLLSELDKNINDFKLIRKWDLIWISAESEKIIAPENFYPIWINEWSYIRMAKKIYIEE
ncbi:MAG: succinylglutamate desuccinylase/aspartoacylase [uncultured bacterium (gcode 4)]|uniref:Succinylglutamate desuccinylase/aspartoacylase n=1 Tax=uncultured bacterium (gcode 4) TaxID=1234023 RepID=K2G4R8_9BACT|nr:MAG: succinylglutamate desuccinylase/aspartoacylase [uncultured bacterium (gcode 4)]